MFVLRRPTDSEIRGFLANQKKSGFSYDSVGLTRTGAAPDGFNVDHNRIRLGAGPQTFARAVDGIRHWKMFAMPQAQLCWPDNRADDSVYYDLFAFSRPRHPLVRMTKPLARRLQKSFVAASKTAMFNHANR